MKWSCANEIEREGGERGGRERIAIAVDYLSHPPPQTHTHTHIKRNEKKKGGVAVAVIMNE